MHLRKNRGGGNEKRDIWLLNQCSVSLFSDTISLAVVSLQKDSAGQHTAGLVGTARQNELTSRLIVEYQVSTPMEGSLQGHHTARGRAAHSVPHSGAARNFLPTLLQCQSPPPGGGNVATMAGNGTGASIEPIPGGAGGRSWVGGGVRWDRQSAKS